MGGCEHTQLSWEYRRIGTRCPRCKAASFLCLGALVLGIGCTPHRKDGEQPQRTVVVIGYAPIGMSFSVDGTASWEHLKRYKVQECVRVPAGELDQLVDRLAEAGFGEEEGRTIPLPSSIRPLSAEVVVTSRALTHSCVFYLCRGLEVPEKYLAPFDALPPELKTPRLQAFISLNRDLGTPAAIDKSSDTPAPENDD